MRILLVTRGLPASGKSTWITRNNLTPYTLSPDTLRLLASSPQENIDGYFNINQKNDSMIWEFFYKLLEARLKRGDFTIIDATNTTNTNLTIYQKLAHQYDYTLFVIDFTHIPIETCLERNRQRRAQGGFSVPDEIIHRMQAQLNSSHLPNSFRTLTPDEWQQALIRPIDLSGYKKIYHIGDLQGCYSVLERNLGSIDPECFYIFLGDYIDRGIENVAVLQYLLTICDLPNVWLLEGNHERHLRAFARGDEASSKEFRFNTQKEIENSTLSRSEISRLCHRLRACLLYRYNDKIVLCSHAGIPRVNLENISFIPAATFINGVGGYGDTKAVADIFAASTPPNLYQIFGHRNTEELPTQVNDRVFVCEGKVEFGGELRIVKLSSEGFECAAYQNDIFKQTQAHSNSPKLNRLIQEFMESKWVRQKHFGDIVSFNFTKEAFNKRVWNSITCKARGIFIDVKQEVIVARSYEKFFNLNETQATNLESLRANLKFPLQAYVKENGFLGIISYYKNKLFMTSKSDANGVFSKHLSDIVVLLGLEDALIAFFQQYPNYSLIFEVIDPINDPHIIAYTEPQLIVLDAICNDIEVLRLPYHELCKQAAALNLACKKHFATLNDFESLQAFLNAQKDGIYNGAYIEGFVIEDSQNFMFKVKGEYYNHWKKMRAIIASHSALVRKNLGANTISAALQFLESLRQNTPPQESNQNAQEEAKDCTQKCHNKDFVPVHIFVQWWANHLHALLSSGDKECALQFLGQGIIALRTLYYEMRQE